MVSPLLSPPRLRAFLFSLNRKQTGKKNLGFCCFLLETSFLFHLWNRVGR